MHVTELHMQSNINTAEAVSIRTGPSDMMLFKSNCSSSSAIDAYHER